MNNTTPWDHLSDFFDVKIDDDNIEGGAMDNIIIAWPPMLEIIGRAFPSTRNRHALDFGCGVGEFCLKLHRLGFLVTGIDKSPKMCDKARAYLPKDIEIISADSAKVVSKKKYENLLSKFGYVQVAEEYPELTEDFLAKYPLSVPPDKVAPSQDPEHMIMAYKKE